MRAYKSLILILFAAAVGFYVYVSLSKRVDSTAPVIECEDETLEISVSDSLDILLSHVAASDEEDGELSGSVIIESVSPFISGARSKVVFAVADSDNNVSKLERELVYTDYTPPVIKLKTPLIFYSGALRADLLTGIEAHDVLEGDVSARVIVESSEMNISEPGVYPITYAVTTEKGVTERVTVNAYVYENRFSESIELSDYIAYTTVGKKLDASGFVDDYPREYLDEDSQSYNGYSYELVIDDSGVDYSKAGTYYVEYRFERTADSNNVVSVLAQTYLAVVVKE